MPPTTIDKVEYLSGRLGGKATLDGMMPVLIKMFEDEGLPALKYEGQTGHPIDGHRLLDYARTLPDPHRTQTALKDALLTQYFHHGRSMTDHDALLSAAEVAGLDLARAKAVLASDAHKDEVLDRHAQAKASGISAVPVYRINGEIIPGGSGAEFLKAFGKLAAQ